MSCHEKKKKDKKEGDVSRVAQGLYLVWNMKFVGSYWFPSVGGMCLLRDTLAGGGRAVGRENCWLSESCRVYGVTPSSLADSTKWPFTSADSPWTQGEKAAQLEAELHLPCSALPCRARVLIKGFPSVSRRHIREKQQALTATGSLVLQEG